MSVIAQWIYFPIMGWILIFQSLVIPDKFQHILRIMNTNIDGKRKVMFAMTAIKGVGRRYSNIVLKKADIDLDKRAGECSEEEVRYFYGFIGSLEFILILSYLWRSCISVEDAYDASFFKNTPNPLMMHVEVTFTW